MSRSGFSASNYLYNPAAFASSGALSVAAWIYPTSIGSLSTIWGMTDADNTNYTLTLNFSATGIVVVSFRNGGSAINAGGLTPVTVDTWNLAGLEFSFAENGLRAIQNASINANVITFTEWPANLDSTAIGARYLDAGVDRAFSGHIGIVAAWNRVLTDEQWGLLAAGTHPVLLPGATPISFWYMSGTAGEQDLFGLFHFAKVGMVTEYVESAPSIQSLGLYCDDDE